MYNNFLNSIYEYMYGGIYPLPRQSTSCSTRCVWALQKHRFQTLAVGAYFFFFPLLPLLQNLHTAQCCGENWMSNLPWETNNIMDPECLLSVMRPNRRLDRRKWCVVLCWDNSTGPPSDDQHRQEVYVNHWVFFYFGPSRVHGGREKLAEQRKWVTPRSEWGRRETLE